MRNRLEALILEMIDGRIFLSEAVAEFEKIYIQKVLERNNSHISKTADALGIHRNTLAKRVSEYTKRPPRAPRSKRNSTGQRKKNSVR
ncbi:MAG: helix-turn-helix domain-containing protein [Acidobacteriota bacterium]